MNIDIQVFMRTCVFFPGYLPGGGIARSYDNCIN